MGGGTSGAECEECGEALCVMGYAFWVMGYALWVMGYALSVMRYALWGRECCILI